MKVYLTGGTGFLGNQIIRDLDKNSLIDTVYIPVRDKYKLKGHERFKQIIKPLSDKTQYIAINENIPGDVDVIVLNAYSVSFTADFDKSIDENVKPIINLLDQASLINGLKKVIFVSTAFVQAPLPTRTSYEPIDLGMEPMPLFEQILKKKIGWNEICQFSSIHLTTNNYIFTKAMLEHVLLTKYSTLPISIIRPSQLTISSEGNYCSTFGTGSYVLLLNRALGRVFLNGGVQDTICVDFASSIIVNAINSKKKIIFATSGDGAVTTKLVRDQVMPNRKCLFFNSKNSYLFKMSRKIEAFIYWWLTLLGIMTKRQKKMIELFYSGYDYFHNNSWDFPVNCQMNYAILYEYMKEWGFNYFKKNKV